MVILPPERGALKWWLDLQSPSHVSNAAAAATAATAELSSSKMIGLTNACYLNKPVWMMRVGFHENCELTLCHRSESRPEDAGGPGGALRIAP